MRLFLITAVILATCVSLHNTDTADSACRLVPGPPGRVQMCADKLRFISADMPGFNLLNYDAISVCN